MGNLPIAGKGDMVKRQSQVSMLLINTYFNSKNIEFIA